MRVITCNLNGIRAAARKGFFDWLSRQRADVVCLQETKARLEQLYDLCYHPRRFHCYYHDAERPGYSGVAMYCRAEPRRIVEGVGWPEFDREGRFLRVDYANLAIISLYFPSGTSGDIRQSLKYQYMERFKPLLLEWRRQRRNLIICGDINIAHKEIDLRNWRSNRKNSGFLPEERAWLDWLFGSAGFVDVFRRLDRRPERYTWWSHRGQAWAKNVGWRIDYHIATPGMARRARACSIYTGRRFSDHAPLTIDYDHVLR